MNGSERGPALWLGALTLVATGALLGIAASNAATPAPAAAEGIGIPLQVDVKEIPDVPWPLEVTAEVVRQFAEKHAAAIIDARDAADYLAGHIPGAINMPFAETTADPARLAKFDAKGKPILVYCGGATCELSRQLAEALLKAGQKKALVYTGGWPDWSQRKYPVETGPERKGV